MQLQTAWLGLLPVYLFLGGLGGAVLLLAGVLDVMGPKRYRRTIFSGAALALGCLVVGALVLLFDLGLPFRGLMLWQSFSNPRSWLSVGAWMLLAAMAASMMLGVASRWRMGSGGGPTLWLRRVLDVACVLLGFAVCTYTGILLMESTAVVSWGTWLLPALFVASSLSAGTASVGALWRWREKPKRARRMGSWSAAELGFLVLEALFLGLYSIWLLSGQLAEPVGSMLFAGRWAPLFWLVVVGVGLVVPFVLSCMGLGRRRHSHAAALTSAVCALAGNLALRFLILAIGVRLPVMLLS